MSLIRRACFRYYRRFLENFSFFLAYTYYGIELFYTLHISFFITAALILFFGATTLHITPFTREQYVFLITPSTRQYMTFLRFLEAQEDSSFAKEGEQQLHISQSRRSPFSEQEKQEILALAHPQERVESLSTFWASVLKQQPTSREAVYALALLSYQQHNTEQAKTYAELFTLLEPNDKRISILSRLL